MQTYTRSYDNAPAGPDPTALSLNLLQLYTLEAIDELAVCNDGSPGGYYFSASTTGSDLWVVYLQVCYFIRKGITALRFILGSCLV